MRGKIGYKRPIFFSGLRVTYFETEILEYAPPAPELRATYFTNEALQYAAPAPALRTTFFSNEALQYAAPAAALRSTFFSNEALQYAAPASVLRATFFSDEALTYKPTAPYPPSGLVATAINGGVELVWYPAYSSGIPPADYTVQYSDDNGATWTTANNSPILTSAYTVTGLTNGQSYLFRARSSNSVGTSSWSDPSNSATPSSGS